MEKKGGVVGIIFFFGLLFIILIGGFIMAVGGAVTGWVFDTAVPEVSNLGMVGDSNITQIAELTVVPMNNLIQNVGWLIGVLYVMALFGSIGFALYSRTTSEKWLIGFYFGLMLLLLMGSVMISNMYEDFYNDAGEFALRLQDQSLISYMIIQSPLIFTIIGFITGIIMFSGMGREETA